MFQVKRQPAAETTEYFSYSGCCSSSEECVYYLPFEGSLRASERAEQSASELHEYLSLTYAQSSEGAAASAAFAARRGADVAFGAFCSSYISLLHLFLALRCNPESSIGGSGSRSRGNCSNRCDPSGQNNSNSYGASPISTEFFFRTVDSNKCDRRISLSRCTATSLAFARPPSGVEIGRDETSYRATTPTLTNSKLGG